MRKPEPFVIWAFAATAVFFLVVVFHLRFTALPVFFLALGFASYAWNGRRALRLFLFLLPLASSTPDLFFNGYPFNYMGMPLFYLAGILCASRLKKERPRTDFPGSRAYLLFLSLLGISVLFVFLRWSNLGLPSLAFLRDTPVAPGQERFSFACIFPAVTLALFALTPWAAFLLRHHGLKDADLFVPLKAGFFLSFLLALVQKWIAPDLLAQAWWETKMGQVNGGFSDFNAFGFFAGAMFLYQALKLLERLPLREQGAGRAKAAAVRGLGVDLLFLAVALAAIFISGCRTAFLFVLLALFPLAFSKKIGRAAKSAVVLALALAIVLAGGTLGKRLRRSAAEVARISSAADLYRTADEISNSRLDMLRNGARMIGRFPVSGVGAGNFLFYLKFLASGKSAYFDLPLNQYLLVFCEVGLAGGIVFIIFLAALLGRRQPGRTRFILAAMAFALFFNNFFWFPEVLLLFWCVVSQGEWGGIPGRKRASVCWSTAAILLFIAMNISGFRALHPRSWAREKGTPYDYGFSYPEKENGRAFRWTAAAAGMDIRLDRGGLSSPFSLACGAPLRRFPDGQQTVDIYWRGKLFQRVVFRENGKRSLQIEDHAHGEGFLEFRVRPAFNLERLGLGSERRDLGVQVFAPET